MSLIKKSELREVKREGGGGFHSAQDLPVKKERTIECYNLCSDAEEEESNQGPIDLTLCTTSSVNEQQQRDPEVGMDSASAPEREPSPAPQPSAADHQRLEEKMAKYQEDAEACSLGGLGLNDVEEDLIGAVVRFMLFSNQDKPGIPVPRSKLNDAIFQDLFSRNKSTDVRGRNAIPKNVIPKAQYRMLKVFGIEMVALERSAESSSKSGAAEHYVLRSALPAALRHAFLPNAMRELREGKAPDPALATVVLSFIELSGGSVEEGEMWQSLEQLGLHKDQQHPHFKAKPSQLMQKLEAAKIIVKKADKRNAGPGETRTVYMRGESAADEDLNINAFIDKVFNSARDRGYSAPNQETHNY